MQIFIQLLMLHIIYFGENDRQYYYMMHSINYMIILFNWFIFESSPFWAGISSFIFLHSLLLFNFFQRLKFARNPNAQHYILFNWFIFENLQECLPDTQLTHSISFYLPFQHEFPPLSLYLMILFVKFVRNLSIYEYYPNSYLY